MANNTDLYVFGRGKSCVLLKINLIVILPLLRMKKFVSDPILHE